MLASAFTDGLLEAFLYMLQCKSVKLTLFIVRFKCQATTDRSGPHRVPSYRNTSSEQSSLVRKSSMCENDAILQSCLESVQRLTDEPGST